MIDEVLKKAENNKKLSDEEYIQLLKIENREDLDKLCNIAVKIRDENIDQIKLTSTIHITNKCQIYPRCKYCGFATETSTDGYYDSFFKNKYEILEAAKSIEEAGIPRVSCSGGHGYNGKQAIKATEIVKDNTSLEVLVNVGADLNEEAINRLKELNTDTICCNLETTNEDLFNFVKPGEKLEDRVNVCRMIDDAGVSLSSGILIGLGESLEDRVAHLHFLNTFKNLEEIPLMGFNPYKGTPMENHPASPLEEQLKMIAVTRIMYPGIRITVPTPTIGPENVVYSLNAGASNLATVIADNYPLDVKGVGSPICGNFKDVMSVINNLDLKAQTLC